MKISFSENIRMASVFILAVGSFVNVWAEEPDSAVWKRSFKAIVVNDVQIPVSTNEVLREGIGTNTIQSASSQPFRLRSYSEKSVPSMENIKAKMMEYDMEVGGQTRRIYIRFVNAMKGRDEAMNGLAYLMGTSTSMGGQPFKQLLGGPGDVCFVFKTEPSGARGFSTLFFCRDNVAVQLISYSAETDLLAVARLIDSSIMTTPVKNK